MARKEGGPSRGQGVVLTLSASYDPVASGLSLTGSPVALVATEKHLMPVSSSKGTETNAWLLSLPKAQMRTHLGSSPR